MFNLMGMIPAFALQGTLKGIGMVILYRLAMRRPHTYKLVAWGMSGAAVVTLLVNLNNWRIVYVITQ